MKTTKFAAIAVGVALGATGMAAPAAAQSPIPLSLEARAAAAFPTGGTWGDLADTGVGFGVSASVQLVPNIGVYGGYSRTTFDIALPGDVRAVDSGFAVGLNAGLGGAAISPWVGAGLLFHSLELENVPTPGGADSQLGFEAGTGLAIALTPRVRFTPAVAYRRYQARLLTTEREPISYISVGAGLNFAF
jgi:opacity protein-like surface antigen